MPSWVGLLAALSMWLVAMGVIAWTWNRHVAVMTASGVEVDDRDRHISVERVARYHTLGWTVVLFIFFVLLDLAAFPLWQRLGFSGLLALVYGGHAISRGEGEWVGRDDPGAFALFGRFRDALWYRVLMVTDWAAYLATIVFGADLAVELIA
ncbi:MAG TPA: hypothetical protein VFT79_02500 [Solirubrobacterales bacterium]|nr:hypothetical protein [Solirubrobacterales bacterium]